MSFVLDPSSEREAVLEVSLQGVTERTHRMKVLLNDAELGEVVYEGQGLGLKRWTIPQSILEEGENLVSLASQGGEGDMSLMDSIWLTYWHTYTAEGETLELAGQGGKEILIGGFGSPGIRVVDITNPWAVQEIKGVIEPSGKVIKSESERPGEGRKRSLPLQRRG